MDAPEPDRRQCQATQAWCPLRSSAQLSHDRTRSRFERLRVLPRRLAPGRRQGLSTDRGAKTQKARSVRDCIVVTRRFHPTPRQVVDVYVQMPDPWRYVEQPFTIENRPGGGGNIAAEAVVRAPADGYTLLMVSSANAINATLYDKLNFDFIRDIAPIAGINHSTYVLAVHPSFSAKTVPEFIAYARQGDPGGQHQGGVIGATSAKYSVTPATRLW